MTREPVIETARLILREWDDADRAPFAAMSRDAEVMRHFPATLDRAESDAMIDRITHSIAAEGFGLWVLERKDDGAFLGFTGLQTVRVESPIRDDVEIGWRLARSYWGRGYAREAAEASLAWMWSNLDRQRVVSMTIADNAPSWGLMRRLGMERARHLDFEHPALAPGDRCRQHVVYVKDRPL